MHLEPIDIFGNNLNLGLLVGLSFDLAFETFVAWEKSLQGGPEFD